jgi:hypothetical protein
MDVPILHEFSRTMPHLARLGNAQGKKRAIQG